MSSQRSFFGRFWSGLSAEHQSAVLLVSGISILGLSDNFVPFVSDEIGLGQFHFMRSAMALICVFGLACAGLSKPAANTLASGDAENGFAGCVNGALFCSSVFFACRHCRGRSVHLTYICVVVFCSVVRAETRLAACSGCADRLSWCMACSAPGQPWFSPATVSACAGRRILCSVFHHHKTALF